MTSITRNCLLLPNPGKVPFLLTLACLPIIVKLSSKSWSIFLKSSNRELLSPSRAGLEDGYAVRDGPISNVLLKCRKRDGMAAECITSE